MCEISVIEEGKRSVYFLVRPSGFFVRSVIRSMIRSCENPQVVELSNSEDSTGEEGFSSESASSGAEKIFKAIEGLEKLPSSLTEEHKCDMLEMALGTIILNLSDNELREVNDETTAYDVWKKLESVYLTKSLTNKIYLKERLFGFKMDPSKKLGQNLDEFKKMTIELANA
ncbi:hypothetical protein Dsin_005107 [Dipteronia sinensis]|uniref:Uncharacterized protein n=1 Tax=Dipteronia sinensis TaxID=43782 RepID=A0AAE0AWT3_9ROSI|nr:hypothetical protein Dsin_005107 [Dipteronia sinensis]